MFIVGVGLAFSGYSQSFVTNGLVADYPFNGSANDVSGNGYNGIVNGASLTTDRFGADASAYLFSGGQAIITTLASPAGTDARTVTGWFLNGSQASQAILAYGGGGPGSRIEVGLNAGNFYLDVYNGDKYWSGNFADSTWHQFILVCTANSTLEDVQLFIDGANITNSSGGRPLLLNTGNSFPMQIGNLFYPGDRRYFTGQIDDIRIYSRALSSGEAAQLYAIEAQSFYIPQKATAIAQSVGADAGVKVDLIKSVKPAFSNLNIGMIYQLQVSGDLSSWTNEGVPFTAAKTAMIYPLDWDVDNWGSLFFRLKLAQ